MPIVGTARPAARIRAGHEPPNQQLPHLRDLLKNSVHRSVAMLCREFRRPLLVEKPFLDFPCLLNYVFCFCLFVLLVSSIV